jgi:hypothetical protein
MADRGAPDGICVAFGSNWNDLSPTWTRLDDPSVPVYTAKVSSPHHCNVVSNWTVDRGRSYETDKTQTGTATITLQDPNGLFDPTNSSSPFFGQVRPMLRAQITFFNPSNKQFLVVFTGFIESWNWTITTEEKLEVVTINLVDGFEPMSRAELTPDSNGVTTIAGDSSPTACQTRIQGLLSAMNWPDDGLSGPNSRWRNVNTGNVFLQQAVYNPGTSYLSAMQDAADAEFPGVANVFINKAGALTFYGRYPRFQPSNFPQDVNLWQVADSISAPSIGAAQIAVLEWDIDQTHLYNACLCYPALLPQADIFGQLYTNSTSAGIYGYRALTLDDLLVAGQPSTPSQNAANAKTTCLYYAQYYVQNYKDPQIRISRMEFHSRLAGDSQTNAFLAGVEIGDLLTVFTHAPGAGGFNSTQFFVEGIHYQVQAAIGILGLVDVTMTLDLSPRAWFTTMPWTV